MLSPAVEDTTLYTDEELAAALINSDDIGSMLAKVQSDHYKRVSSSVHTGRWGSSSQPPSRSPSVQDPYHLPTNNNRSVSGGMMAPPLESSGKHAGVAPLISPALLNTQEVQLLARPPVIPGVEEQPVAPEQQPSKKVQEEPSASMDVSTLSAPPKQLLTKAAIAAHTQEPASVPRGEPDISFVAVGSPVRSAPAADQSAATALPSPAFGGDEKTPLKSHADPNVTGTTVNASHLSSRSVRSVNMHSQLLKNYNNLVDQSVSLSRGAREADTTRHTPSGYYAAQDPTTLHTPYKYNTGGAPAVRSNQKPSSHQHQTSYGSQESSDSELEVVESSGYFAPQPAAASERKLSATAPANERSNKNFQDSVLAVPVHVGGGEQEQSHQQQQPSSLQHHSSGHHQQPASSQAAAGGGAGGAAESNVGNLSNPAQNQQSSKGQPLTPPRGDVTPVRGEGGDYYEPSAVKPPQQQQQQPTPPSSEQPSALASPSIPPAVASPPPPPQTERKNSMTAKGVAQTPSLETSKKEPGEASKPAQQTKDEKAKEKGSFKTKKQQQPDEESARHRSKTKKGQDVPAPSAVSTKSLKKAASTPNAKAGNKLAKNGATSGSKKNSGSNAAPAATGSKDKKLLLSPGGQSDGSLDRPLRGDGSDSDSGSYSYSYYSYSSSYYTDSESDDSSSNFDDLEGDPFEASAAYPHPSTGGGRNMGPNQSLNRSTASNGPPQWGAGRGGVGRYPSPGPGAPRGSLAHKSMPGRIGGGQPRPQGGAPMNPQQMARMGAPHNQQQMMQRRNTAHQHHGQMQRPMSVNGPQGGRPMNPQQVPRGHPTMAAHHHHQHHHHQHNQQPRRNTMSPARQPFPQHPAGTSRSPPRVMQGNGPRQQQPPQQQPSLQHTNSAPRFQTMGSFVRGPDQPVHPSFRQPGLGDRSASMQLPPSSNQLQRAPSVRSPPKVPTSRPSQMNMQRGAPVPPPLGAPAATAAPPATRSSSGGPTASGAPSTTDPHEQQQPAAAPAQDGEGDDAPMPLSWFSKSSGSVASFRRQPSGKQAPIPRSALPNPQVDDVGNDAVPPAAASSANNSPGRGAPPSTPMQTGNPSRAPGLQRIGLPIAQPVDEPPQPPQPQPIVSNHEADSMIARQYDQVQSTHPDQWMRPTYL